MRSRLPARAALRRRHRAANGEECDDGNKKSGDGCAANCSNEIAEVTRSGASGPDCHADPGRAAPCEHPVARRAAGLVLRRAMEAVAGPGSHRILVRWLVGLRWVLVGILAATLPLGESVMGFHVRWEVAVPAVVALGAFNLWVQRRLAARGEASMRFVAVTAVVDLAGIAVVLAASGGAANPLSALFFVHVALAASLLPALPTFGLLALATAMFGSLFLLPSGACCAEPPRRTAPSPTTSTACCWRSCSAARLVAWFLTRVRRALEAGERRDRRAAPALRGRGALRGAGHAGRGHRARAGHAARHHRRARR